MRRHGGVGRRALLGVAGLGGLAGCVSVSPPSLAHVHVGHALSGWSDTPQRQGLLVVARQDARVALEHAEFAVQGARNLAAVRLHLSHVRHALAPQLEPGGPGSGYGLLRALGGAAEHLGYAREVPDVSAALKAGLPGVLEALQVLRRDAQLLELLARDGRGSVDPGQALAYAQEAQGRAQSLVTRLERAQQRLDALLAAEQPPYRTVAQRYLFGIVRLPNGDWAFSSERPARRGAY